MLVKHYPLYSYEAIPFTKLLNLFGFDVYAFNLQCPPKIISYLAENPYLVKSIVYLAMSLILMIIGLKIEKIKQDA